MRKIIVIGTLHLGLTPKNELKKVLEEIKPDQLLVELPAEEAVRTKATNHSDEMGFAATWAEAQNISVNFYATNTGNVLKDGCNEADSEYRKLVDEQVEEIKAFSWKELNSKSLWEQGRLGEIQRRLYTDYFDIRKWTAREKEMLKNIQQEMQEDGTIVVLTGIGHLDFFEQNIPYAKLLFRD